MARMIEKINEQQLQLWKAIRQSASQAIWIADLSEVAEEVLLHSGGAQAKADLIQAASHIRDAEWEARKPSDKPSDAVMHAASLIHDIAVLWSERPEQIERKQREQMREALTYLQGVAEGMRLGR